MNNHSLCLTILSDALLPVWQERTWAWGQKARFVEWTAEGANGEIAKHDVALVPQRSKYKSSNRSTTAWALGVVPVATGPALEQMLDYDTRRRHAELGRKQVEQEYDVRLSVQDWKRLLDKYLARRAAANSHLDYVRNAKGA